MNVTYRSASSSPEHNRLIQSTVAEMKRQGMSAIRASHIPGFTQPDIIGGYIPDATAQHGTSLCIAEAETADGLADTHTVDQWTAFFNYAVKVGGYFIAVVAKADEVKARILLRQVAKDSPRAILWTF